jgi:predicted nuclease of predicted toxin-antitoxin system
VTLGLEKELDQHVWNYAKMHDFVIVSRDSDFHEMSLLHGAPPKIIWLKTGNQSKAAVLNTLVSNCSLIEKILLIVGRDFIEIY